MAQFNETLGFHVYMRPVYEKQTDDDRLLARYDAVRSGVTRGALVDVVYDQERYARFVRLYERFKEVRHLVDFSDCLLRFKEAGKPVGVKVAFIDEAQDLTTLQWEVCRIAFSRCEKIMVSGDDYQSLFTYCGANPQVLIELSKRYPTVKLEKSYRLPLAVYRFAKGIVSIIGKKADKDFVPVKGVEGFVADIFDWADLARRIWADLKKNGPLPGRWFLLFRNNCFIEQMADLLERYTIPYHDSRGFVIPDRDLSKLRRYFNYRKEGFGDAEMRRQFCAKYRIRDITDDFTESDLIPSERRYVYQDYLERYGLEALEEMAVREPFLLLSTTHRVKGGEADFVAAFMDCTRRVSENRLFNADEELRVLYVACTRSRLGLYLVRTKESGYGVDRIVEAVKEMTA
jgi:superfamily I DNA/RNA helicase